MSELKVNTISEVTGANGVVVDSVKLKDGGVIIADAGNIGSASDTDAIAIASNGAVTFSQAASFSSTIASTGAITSNAGVVVDNITIDGTEIDLSSGDLTLDVAGDIILDADGGDVKISDGGTHIGTLTNSSSDFVVTSAVQDKDIIFKGDDGGSAITALTLDMSAAGDATFNNQVIVGDGKLVLNSTAVTATAAEINLIDGGTSRGTTAVASGDGLLVNDGGTMRMTNIDTVASYIEGLNNRPCFYAYGSAATTVVNNTLTRIEVANEVVDYGGCYNNTANNATLNSLTVSPYSFTPNVAGLYYFVGAIQLNTTNFNVGLVNNLGSAGGSETYAALVYRKSDTNNGMVTVSGYALMNGTGNQVSLNAHQESGSNIDTNNSIYTTFFGGFLVAKT